MFDRRLQIQKKKANKLVGKETRNIYTNCLDSVAKSLPTTVYQLLMSRSHKVGNFIVLTPSFNFSFNFIVLTPNSTKKKFKKNSKFLFF